MNEQAVTTPSHFALVHYGDGEMREMVLDFLRPALEDQKQAIYLCGPPGGASRLLRFLERSAGMNLRDEVELCERGLSPVRVVGPAAWNVFGYSAPEDFLWYESRILPAIEGLPAAIMCTYDAAQLPAPALLYGALETHSHTMINGVISKSSYFMPADRYLKTRLIHLPWLEPEEEKDEVISASGDGPARGPRNRTR